MFIHAERDHRRVEFGYVPQVGAAPLVADFSSTFLSRPIDVGRFGLIYAGAQKNVGPAGLCIVIVREDLIGHARPGTPQVLDYKAMADDGSMLNTPPTFAWYIAGLVLKWIGGQGGLGAMEKLNRAKAEALYGGRLTVPASITTRWPRIGRSRG